MRTTFQHDAVLYAGEDAFLGATLPFLREGIANAEPMLVAVADYKIARLRSALGCDADRVQFVDMLQLGRNPACIIPAWQAFVDANASNGRSLRGIGEPVDACRTPEELVECHAHESLLNSAFDRGPGWRLICPYDVAALDEATIREARTTHSGVIEDGVRRGSAEYRPRSPYDGPLPPAPVARRELAFAGDLSVVRRFVSQFAHEQGFSSRADDLALAASELAANSVLYGAGSGTLRAWKDDATLVCEVEDRGWVVDQLAGRVAPSAERLGGAGLWLVNHICDFVQIRSCRTGTVVRVRISRS